MQKFCHNCGKQVVMGAKFCNECGCNLTSLTNNPPSSPPSSPPGDASRKRSGQFTPFAANADNEDDDYIDKLEHLDIRQNALHVEIVRDRPIGESVGSLVAQTLQGGTAPADEPSRPAAYQDGGQYLAEFSREAGTSGPANGKN